jgi:TfoX N-terminal domain
MAYDQKLAERVKTWATKHPSIEVKAMFGGLCYLVGGNMLGGVKDTNLLLRLGPAGASHIGKPHILPFPTWAKPMAGFLMVEPAGCATAPVLAKWLDQAHAFATTLPPKAKKVAAKPATKAAGSAAKNRPAAAKPATGKPAQKPSAKKR